jgi:4-hydroxybenzoate polyprenyltransferase
MATPAFSALLWLGTFPPAEVVILGLITAFSGYTAVYALNDVIDYRVDQEKIQASPLFGSKQDLDDVYVRHPLARGLLSYGMGLSWVVAWAALAMVGAYLLNPVCTFIFLLACVLEVVYCRLLKITHLRGIISGAVKTSGPVAAVLAVDPRPDILFLMVLFLWLFAWEIGGQNIPNDWGDMEEDRKIQAKTIPVFCGHRGSLLIIFSSLFIALAMSLVMYWISPRGRGVIYLVGAFFSGFYFCLLPGYRLYQTKTSEEAFHLFNRASYYPLAMLMVTMISWAI